MDNDEVVMTVRGSPSGPADAGAAARRRDLGEELRSITRPAVLLSGTLDQLVPAADVKKAAALLPRGRFVSITGAGHWLPRDAPEQLATEIAAVSREIKNLHGHHP